MIRSILVATALSCGVCGTADAAIEQDLTVGGPVCDGDVLRDLASWSRRGNSDAQFEHGMLLLFGHCVGRDEDAGIKELQLAAAQGHAEAAFNLGRWYSDTTLTLFDLSEARRYLLIAAEHGHAEAQHMLGLMLVRGEGGRVEQDTGLYWLGSAASEGYGFSALIMGKLHEVGHFGVVKDACLARDWYEASVLLGVSGAQGHVTRIDHSVDCF